MVPQLVRVSYENDAPDYYQGDVIHHTAIYERLNGMPIEQEDIDDLVANYQTIGILTQLDISYIDAYTVRVDYTTDFSAAEEI